MSKTVSPAKAARLLGVHYNTVYSWCRGCVEGSPTRLKQVTQNPLNGRYNVDLGEIRKLKGSIL